MSTKRQKRYTKQREKKGGMGCITRTRCELWAVSSGSVNFTEPVNVTDPSLKQLTDSVNFTVSVNFYSDIY